MPGPSKDLGTSGILGEFVSIVGLLGFALFFTGWIYRWAYFSFFQLDITSLELPVQSFFIVPIQVFFGSPGALARSASFLAATIVLIFLVLRLAQLVATWCKSKLEFLTVNSSQLRAIPWLTQTFELITGHQINPQKRIQIKLFLTELLIAFCIFIMLFWTARIQGSNDAWRDAQQKTSRLPVVSLVTPLEGLPLGRKLEDVFEDLSLESFSFIGDKGLFDTLRGKEDTDIVSDPNQPRVWRLLSAHGEWIYLFITLPVDADRVDRPSVVAIQRGGGQLMILSPTASEP